jgi:hypothetical protein
MADFELDKKIGGKPAYVWIVGGVAVALGAYYFINRRGSGSSSVTTSADTSAMQYGYTPTAAAQEYGVQGVPGTPGQTTNITLPPGTTIKVPVTQVPVKVPKVQTTPPAKNVSAGKAAVTTTKKTFTAADVRAAQARKTAAATRPGSTSKPATLPARLEA